ncbi:MAG: restriction endonuclease subunit S [Rhodocyclaceae bacterium]|nr:restriction endonuclease subunit S [Rhodocyclaceae bacterium]
MVANSASWPRLKVISLCEAHVDCVNRTAPVVEGPTPFKMLRTTNVRDGYVDVENVRYVSEETYTRWTRRLVPRKGDIILTREAPLGDVGKIRTDDRVFLGQRLYHFRPDPTKLDADFLLYSLLSNDLQSQIKGFGSGSTVEHMRLEDIPALEFNVPSLLVQRRIASILSAYDDLIENSQRRIKILESMARALYREWFVHFRFPGHENHPRVASPLGEIPEGWEVRSTPECVDINPRVTVPREGEKPFVPMGCLSNDSMLITDIESRAGNSGSKFQNGDTLFARITPCLENGKTGYVQFLPSATSVAFGSTEFIVLRSRTLTPEFVYLLARSDEFRGLAIKSMSGATGRQRVQEQCFNDFQIVQPTRDVLEAFSSTVAPSFQLIFRLHSQIENLRRTRDLLVPRLLSGQVNLQNG